MNAWGPCTFSAKEKRARAFALFERYARKLLSFLWLSVLEGRKGGKGREGKGSFVMKFLWLSVFLVDVIIMVKFRFTGLPPSPLSFHS